MTFNFKGLAFLSGPRKVALVDRGPLHLKESVEVVRPATSRRTLQPLVMLSSRFQPRLDFGAQDATREG